MSNTHLAVDYSPREWQRNCHYALKRFNVFVLHQVQPDISTRTIFRGVLPFVSADVLRVALLVAFPAIALWLPGLMG